MTGHIGWIDRVAAAIYRDLTEREGVAPQHAAVIGQAALLELTADPSLRELHVLRIVDSEGGEHAVVTPRMPVGDPLPLWTYDVAAIGRRARRAVAADSTL